MPYRYPPEFRRRILDLIASGRSVASIAVVGDSLQRPGGGLSSDADRFLTAWRGDSCGQAPCAHLVDQQSHGAVGSAPGGGVSGTCHLGARWGRDGARESQNQCKMARDVAGSVPGRILLRDKEYSRDLLRRKGRGRLGRTP